ncbi:MAG: hypothetical protein WA757_14100, partial [Candidatus Acidiferrales bacterium]
LRTDWLRREEVMKTTRRENQKRYSNHVASRAHGTEGEHKPAQWGGLDARKTPATGEVFFFLTPFMERLLTKNFSKSPTGRYS